MAEFSNELVSKLKKAGSLDEVTELLKADGQDETQAEDIWQKIEQLHASENQELSLDELDSVSGGRDWLTEGCAATVEPSSDCWGTDGGCPYVNVTYQHMPNTSTRCPTCGGYLYQVGYYYGRTGFLEGRFYKDYICRKCGPFRVYED